MIAIHKPGTTEQRIQRLTEYRDAIAKGDKNTLRDLLADGGMAKEQIDGRKTSK